MRFVKPRIKRHLHAFSHSTPETMDLGFHFGRESGLVIEDIDETQVYMISLLDGEHTFAEIVHCLQTRFPTVTKADVAESLDALAEMKVIEDAAAEIPAELNATDLERYANQIRFFSILDSSGQQRYAMQARLKRARVAVIGLGGLGSNMATGLAAAGVGTLRLIDGDTIELRNLNRQVLYDTADVGREKAIVAAEHLQRFNPELTLDAIPQYIQHAADLTARMQGIDVAALCADGPHMPEWMNAVSLASGVPFLMGGYRGLMAEVGPFVVPGETGCLMCYPHAHDTHPLPEQLTWINEATRLRHPTTFFVSALAASLATAEIIKYLTGMAQPATYNHMLQLDSAQFTLEDFPWGRLPTCQACSHLKEKTVQ